jgi:hypothetical protein
MLRSNIQMDMGSPVWAGVDRTITSLGRHRWPPRDPAVFRWR